MILAGTVRSIELTHGQEWLRVTLAHDDSRPWTSFPIPLHAAREWHVGQRVAGDLTPVMPEDAGVQAVKALTSWARRA